MPAIVYKILRENQSAIAIFWITSTIDMRYCPRHTVNVAPDYFRTLIGMLAQTFLQRKTLAGAGRGAAQ